MIVRGIKISIFKDAKFWLENEMRIVDQILKFSEVQAWTTWVKKLSFHLNNAQDEGKTILQQDQDADFAITNLHKVPPHFSDLSRANAF